MGHIGILTEYNPFHKGHAYQLKKAKELYPNKKIIVLMSGNYVQRGEPSIFNKYVRAQCAISDLADVIFELPVFFATSSAEFFAYAAVKAFHNMKCIDTLCFGAETDNLPLLQEIAGILVQEPDTYKKKLQHHIKEGFSYPKARLLALSSYLSDENVSNIMKQPNNILAIEYLKALNKIKSDIQPVLIQRVQNNYHDSEISDGFSSATAIRKQIKQTHIKDIQTTIPKETNRILKDNPLAKPLFYSDFYPFLEYALWKEEKNLEYYLDISQDIANLIRSFPFFPQSIEELSKQLLKKQYTATRIQRALLHILLDIKEMDIQQMLYSDNLMYLRLLALKTNASSVIKKIQTETNIPIITKVANAHKLLSKEQFQYFHKEIKQNQLYTQAFYNKYGLIIPSEYEHSVIISDL